MSKIEHGYLSGIAVGLLIAVSAVVVPGRVEAKDTKDDVAAVVGDEVITLSDLDKVVFKTNAKLAQSLYSARKTALDQLLLERAFAKEAAAAGKTPEQFVKERLAADAPAVTTQEINAYYEANKARLGGKTLAQMSARIGTFLKSQRAIGAQRTLLAQVKKRGDVKVSLDAPRITVLVAADDPVKGPKDAKVTIVEFSDFQ